MVDFKVEEGKIEIVRYRKETSLQDLVEELDLFRRDVELKSRFCKDCCECCSDLIPILGLDLKLFKETLGFNNLQLPQPPDLQKRKHDVQDMEITLKISDAQSVALYDYNNSDPITTNRHEDGSCCLLENGRCSAYSVRPYMCAFYLCTMGDRLACLQEAIIGQGTWHAYFILGWVSEIDIEHNPFRSSNTFAEVRLDSFELFSEQLMKQLFFFF